MSPGVEQLEQQLNPRAGCWILAAPIAMTVVIVGGYLALIAAGFVGRPARGDVVTMDFTGCAEARPVIEARVAQMGLGNPVFTSADAGFSLTAQLPGDLEGDAEIPVTLARIGQLELRTGEEPDGEPIADSAQIDSAIVRLDLAATPSTGLQLDEAGTAALLAHMKANPEGVVSIWLDGEQVGKVRNDPPEAAGRIDLLPTGRDARAQLRDAAARAIAIDSGPLPCPVQVSTRPQGD